MLKEIINTTNNHVSNFFKKTIIYFCVFSVVLFTAVNLGNGIVVSSLVGSDTFAFVMLVVVFVSMYLFLFPFVMYLSKPIKILAGELAAILISIVFVFVVPYIFAPFLLLSSFQGVILGVILGVVQNIINAYINR